ncbi:MAG: PD-(D/E)XK nuclease family protein [Candidatus Eremiobacteraeota bacterium]|nr:PD-(D/E)XK nuclease family protein [Candidatus Eremiobacteraeota bacterium]
MPTTIRRMLRAFHKDDRFPPLKTVAVQTSAESRAFKAAALAYFQDRRDTFARRLFRSPFSGVRGEVSAAICTIAEPKESTLEAIASGRLALSPDERDRVLAFAKALREASGVDDFLRRLPPLEQSEPAPDPSELYFREPAAREIGSAMRSRHAHFSASSLNTYVECGRKWFYRYLCAAVEDKGSSASFYGTAFHAALEELHKEFPHPCDVAVAMLRSKLQGFVHRAFDIYASGFETRIELELQRRRAIRTANRYVEWLAAQAAKAPFTVVGCELPAQLTIEGYDFIGYIDRLDRDDGTGNVTVIDYKTGAIAQSADEYREKVRQFKEFQLPFYYWARTAEGDRVTRLALVPLKDALLEVDPVSLEVVPVATESGKRSGGTTGLISITDLERARTRMIEICRELTDGTLEHFPVTEDPSACRYCAYANACNGRPWPAQELFGR